MGWLMQTKGSIVSQTFTLLESVGNLRANLVCDVALFDDQIIIKECVTKNSATLKYDQITGVECGYKDEIVEKNKSVIGRAVAGGLLLGGIGAVVGGMSGVGKKQKKKTIKYFIISYTASDDTDQFLLFEDTQFFKTKKIINTIKELAKLEDDPPASKEPTTTQL
ncbi:MAG: hypothetical protein SOR93_10815 [Clostridiales Family XIII bacterium]|uniref:Uncharacterized protein n=1 Tax=Hominibacterium faecale TaxID=2839743 RepID=A0A9J6QR83_9FIRM|nr:hypothetical protein [Hominibacterium faecale]MCI7304074.1 hypothetical protein [Clostridia bacterium]MCU7379753.1 hypothetical protein [Hominibacterium faecale]MDY3011724.1 hypothetical protein [Clostridiales Family XIII bacterium]